MNDVSRNMAKIACHALSEKKAEDIQVIDISEISVIADYFVIASAANTNQLQAMMDAAEEDLYKAGFHCAQKEGNNNSSWILMDIKILLFICSLKKIVYSMIWRESGRMERLSHQKIFNSFCGLKIYYLILIREHQQFVSVANNRSLRKIAGVLNLHCDICKFLRHPRFT